MLLVLEVTLFYVKRTLMNPYLRDDKIFNN